MESDSDVFSNWAVVEVSPRIYLGELSLGPDDEGFYTLKDGFELVVVRANVPLEGGGFGMAQQNMHTPFPLCVEGEPMRIKPMGIRRLKDMTAASRNEHIVFIQSAQKSFLEERAKKSNIHPASMGDLANIGRGRRA